MRTAEQEAVLRSILKLIDFWDISPEELQFDAPVREPMPAEPQSTGTKYRHPISGETWDGVGSQPQWLRLALTKEGYTVEELRCLDK